MAAGYVDICFNCFPVFGVLWRVQISEATISAKLNIVSGSRLRACFPMFEDLS